MAKVENAHGAISFYLQQGFTVVVMAKGKNAHGAISFYLQSFHRGGHVLKRKRVLSQFIHSFGVSSVLG